MAAAGGWATAVFVVLLVLFLIVLGKLVPGKAHDEDIAREEKAREGLERRLDAMADVLREQTGYLRFTVDFVKDVIAERSHRRDA